MFLLVEFCLLTFLTISIVYFSIKTGISPMPTSSAAKQAILAALPLSLEGKIYELGAGFGTLLVPLIKKYPRCELIGYELSPFPAWIARLRVWKRAKVMRKDFYHASLSDARLIYCYLFPKAMEKLKEKFEKELGSETIIITNSFRIPGWIAEETISVDDLFKTTIYVYKQQRVDKE